MATFEVPSREEVNAENQQIFDQLQSKVGRVPNIYATYAYSNTALSRYMQFANGPSSLSYKETEAINLVVSQVNGCSYCQAAHTGAAKQNGFSEEEILELRRGQAPFNTKLDALVKLAKSIVTHSGKVEDAKVDQFLNAGYSKENLVDVVVAVGAKSITNYLHNLTDIPIDFPEAPVLEEA